MTSICIVSILGTRCTILASLASSNRQADLRQRQATKPLTVMTRVPPLPPSPSSSEVSGVDPIGGGAEGPLFMSTEANEVSTSATVDGLSSLSKSCSLGSMADIVDDDDDLDVVVDAVVVVLRCCRLRSC